MSPWCYSAGAGLALGKDAAVCGVSSWLSSAVWRGRVPREGH